MISPTLLLASALALYLGLIAPVLGKARYQAFLGTITQNPTARSKYYVGNMLSKWLLLAILGVIMLMGSIPASAFGLQAPENWPFTLWLITQIAVMLWVTLVVAMIYIIKTQNVGPAFMLRDIKELLPHTSNERFLWVPLSITAGVCEEILFRGFLPWYFFQIGSSAGLHISFMGALVISTILFGFAHFYQGWKGMVATGLAGAVFTYLYALTGSLVLPIVVHILVDARIVLLAPLFLKMDEQAR